MAEIKSTLDIIMEKTKGLTMTEEEKKVFHKREIEGKMRGLLQRYVDGFIHSEQLKDEIRGLGKAQYSVARDALLRECLDRIEPGAENGPFLDVLEHAAGVDITPVQKILMEYDHDIEYKKRDREQALRKNLEGLGFFGTAVIPNIHADQMWVSHLSEMKKGFHEKIEELFT